MPGNDRKLHISYEERTKWDKVVTDFAAHLGAGGINNHKLATGTEAGFTIENFTNADRTKLDGIAPGALNNPHPEKHPWTMIEGLAEVAHSGKYSDLIGIPNSLPANGGNADTVGGIRITIGPTGPNDPKENKELWFDTTNKLTKVYCKVGDTGNLGWNSWCAVYA